MNRKLKLKTSRAKPQALIANEHGQAIEASAKTLQKHYQVVADYGYEIEEQALLMQNHTQCSLMYELLQEQGSYPTDLSIEHQMTEKVVSQARDWGFICNCEPNETWQLLSQHKSQRWKLQSEGDRWLLIVGNVPQISFPPEEALAFLELRRPSAKLNNR